MSSLFPSHSCTYKTWAHLLPALLLSQHLLLILDHVFFEPPYFPNTNRNITIIISTIIIMHVYTLLGIIVQQQNAQNILLSIINY